MGFGTVGGERRSIQTWSMVESSSLVAKGVAWLMLFLRCFVAAMMQSVGVREGRWTMWWLNWTVSDVHGTPISFITTS